MQLYTRKTPINPNRFKYTINQDFFKKWNLKMAYILGFTFADGNIHGCSLAWDLKNDLKLLREINKAMKSNYPIEKRRDSFRLRISNPIILQDIQKLGIIPNKTRTCYFPNVPEKFLKDFVRGFLDGDGWIYIRKKKDDISVGFSNGSYKFLRGLAKNLNKRLNLTKSNLRTRKKITKKNKIATTYQVEWYGMNALKIIKFLYDDLKGNDLSLKRKYRKQIHARRIYEDILRAPKKYKYRKIEKKYKTSMQKLLQKLLIEERCLGVEIAKKFNVHPSSIYRWLNKTRVRLPSKRGSKEWVRRIKL